MNYQVKLVDRQWRITADDELLPEVYTNGIEVHKALKEFRKGATATFAGEMTRKQAARKDYREATGR